MKTSFSKKILFVKVMSLHFFFFLTLSLSQIKIHKTFSTSDGLINNHINEILYDSYGYLWFATNNGVSKWDGVNFYNYSVNNGLPSSIAYDIEESNDSTIFISTYGKGIVTIKNDKLDTLDTNDGLISNFVHEIKKYDGKIYVNSGGNIQVFKGNRFERLPKICDGNFPDVKAGFLVNKNDLILGSVSYGLFVCKNGKFKHFTNKDGLNSNFISKLIYDKNNNIIIGTAKGPNKLINGKIVGVKYLGKRITYPVHNLLLTKNGSIVYSTSNGVYIESTSGIKNISENNGLPYHVVWSAEEDNNGNLYFGTNGYGFAVYENDKFVNFKNIDNINLNKIGALALSKSGNLIIGAVKDLYFFDKHNTLKKYFNFSLFVINSISTITDGTLFVNTENGSIVFDGKNKNHILKKNSIILNSINSSVEGIDGIIYLASPSGVIKLTNNETTKITKADGLAGNFIQSLYFSSDISLYIGTHGQGFTKYKNEKAINYTKEDGLSDLSIKCFLELDDGSICIGTANGGISILKNNTFFNINKEFGLLSNNIIGLAKDSSGTIYASSNNGISIINFEDNIIKIKILTKKDGLIEGDLQPESIVVDDSNFIWIASKNGLSKYNPKQNNYNDSLPVYINGLEIFNTPQDLLEFRLNPELNYDENYLKFSYIGINLTSPHKTLYAYKLSGVDKDWVITDETDVQYTSLDNGSYNFFVKAKNELGAWSEPASLSFVINPAWWETWWARLLFISTLGFLLWLAFQYRLNYLLKLERLRTKIASDLHDEVGSMLTQISLNVDFLSFTKDEKKKEEKSNFIRSKTNEIINIMNDIVWSIDSRNDNMESLVERIRNFAYDHCSQKDISLNFNENIDNKNKQLKITFRQNIMMIAKEAINNAVKYSDCTELLVKIDNSNNKFELFIKDNGKGFDFENVRKGNGLKNMKMRAESINAEIDFENKNGFSFKLIKNKI